MEIGNKLQDITDKIVAGDKDLANKIALAGIKAMFAGIGSFNHKGVVTQVNPQWEDFMKLITNNPEELARLCGKEERFNKTDWGLACLAYITGDSTCTSQTTFKTGMKRTMLEHPDRKMLDLLDEDPDNLKNLENEGSVFTEISDE